MTESKERVLFLEVIHSTPSLGPYSFELLQNKESESYTLCIEEGFPMKGETGEYKESDGADVLIREVEIPSDQTVSISKILTDKISEPADYTLLEDGTIHFGDEGKEDGTSYELEIGSGPNKGKLSWSEEMPPEWKNIEELLVSFYETSGFKREEDSPE